MLDSLLKHLAVTPDGTTMPTMFDMLERLIATVLLGVLLSLLYSVTHRASETKSSFLRTLVVLPLVATIITLVIGNSLVRAFGLLGAVALVRFRTRIKNTLDMAFIFLAITLGMASGTQLLPIGIVGLIVFGSVLGIMDIVHFGKWSRSSQCYIITVRSENVVATRETITHGLGDLMKSLRVTEISRGKNNKISYKIVLCRGISQFDLIQRIHNLPNEHITQVKLTKC